MTCRMITGTEQKLTEKQLSDLEYSTLILNSPVARSLAVIGDRWAFLILRDVFLGIRRFEALRTRSGAARGTLTARLKSLVENEILYRKPYQESPTRYEYRLTERGVDLYPMVMAVWDWETRWSQENEIPPALTHIPCDHDFRPLFRCADCHELIRLREVSFKPGDPGSEAESIPARFQRRTRTPTASEEGVDRRFFHVLDVIGDRWSGLVVAAMYFGLNRYDEIASALDIATNVLSDRLKLLVANGILQKVPYQRRPVRHQYRLTEKGAALYNVTLQMHEWACRWLLEENQEPVILFHRLCGAQLHSEMVCSHCEAELHGSEVAFERDFELP